MKFEVKNAPYSVIFKWRSVTTISVRRNPGPTLKWSTITVRNKLQREKKPSRSVVAYKKIRARSNFCILCIVIYKTASWLKAPKNIGLASLIFKKLWPTGGVLE